MPPNKKHTQNHGLGKALINHRAKSRHLEHQTELHTTHVYDNKPISVTQESDLENFLNTATLAAQDFTAHRQNVVIINSAERPSGPSNPGNPFLLSVQDHAKLEASHRIHKHLLRVPRRPKWSQSTTAPQLERLERDGFLEWRKGLAELSDHRSLLLTPFERNIQVWRQLWRVLERSQLIVQIVDARNPLRFRCQDLEKYVQELSNDLLATLDSQPGSSELSRERKLKTNLLLVNKSDLLTEQQRSYWAEYFDSQGIQFAFFSAANAAALQALQGSEGYESDDPQDLWQDEEDTVSESNDLQPGLTSSQAPLVEDPVERTDSPADKTSSPSSQVIPSIVNESIPQVLPSTGLDRPSSNLDPSQPKTKILTVDELEDLFRYHANKYLIPSSSTNDVTRQDQSSSQRLVVGLVGYPNVGKSSTINALVGSKKVSVSATPGKTKHFQTIHLSPDVILCDCPGLVFPQFASTKAELVCDGVLPIDQMREHTGPISLVIQRIPKSILEATYGLQLPTLPSEEGGDGTITASQLLTTYAIARGVFTGGGGMGRPDESKVARPILKDYVSAKLLYCAPPPLPGLDPDKFNAETREMRLKGFSQRKLAPTTRVPQDSDTFIKPISGEPSVDRQSSRSMAIDRKFLEESRHQRDLKAGAFTATAGIRFGIKGRRMMTTDGGKVLETTDDLSRLRLTTDRNLHSIDHRGQPVQHLKLDPQDGFSSKKHFKRTFNPRGKSKGKKMRSGKGYDDF